MCIHAHVYAYTYTYTCMCVHAYIDLYVCPCTRVRAYIHMYVCSIHTSVPRSINKCNCNDSMIFMLIYVCMTLPNTHRHKPFTSQYIKSARKMAEKHAALFDCVPDAFRMCKSHERVIAVRAYEDLQIRNNNWDTQSNNAVCYMAEDFTAETCSFICPYVNLYLCHALFVCMPKAQSHSRKTPCNHHLREISKKDSRGICSVVRVHPKYLTVSQIARTSCTYPCT